MLYANTIRIVMCLCAMKSMYARDLNKITREKLIDLFKTYPNIKDVLVQSHPIYAIENDDYVSCLKPWSNEKHMDFVHYGKIRISDKTLSEIVKLCLEKQKYDLAYVIILNIIESIGLTYIYRFCEFAVLLNKNNVKLNDSLEDFINTFIPNLLNIFTAYAISTTPINYFTELYNNHRPKLEKNNYMTYDSVYVNDLLGYMQSIEAKIDFVNLGHSKIPEKQMTVQKRIEMQNNDFLNAMKLLFNANSENGLTDSPSFSVIRIE